MNFNLFDMTPKFNIQGKCGSSQAQSYEQLLEYDCFSINHNYSYFPLMPNYCEFPFVKFENIANLSNAFRETRTNRIYNPIYTSHEVDVNADYAFYMCDWLEEFAIDSYRVNTFSNAFDECYSLINVRFVNPMQLYSLNLHFDHSYSLNVDYMLESLPFSNNMSYVRFAENITTPEQNQMFLNKNWTVKPSL